MTIFRYDQLKQFLIHTRDARGISTVGDWKGSHVVILRHDVDLSITSAHRLARVERECDVRSSFFIMMTHLTYNPFFHENGRMIREIADWGFEVGLHFDPTAYGICSKDEMSSHLEAEAKRLGELSGKPVRSVSLHNPTVFADSYEKYPFFPGFMNAYDPRIFGPDRYLSDSRMVFRHDVYSFVERMRDHPVQILLHPEFYSEEGGTYADTMYGFVREFLGQMDVVYQVNSSYNEQVKNELFAYLHARIIGGER